MENKGKPVVLEILKLLPKSNCQKCGQPTCMVFAIQTAEGIKGADDCPSLEQRSREMLEEYLGGFNL
jgi:CO dehydrogenase/acetyl-CoA synthase gamma subunit (corrinoid Fe-S protein)